MGERILLIDSTRLASDELCRYLNERGYQVSIARSGKMALREATHSPPDLIILDTTSTRFNGKRLCSALYQRVDAPIIAIVNRRSEPLECADQRVLMPVSARKLSKIFGANPGHQYRR